MLLRPGPSPRSSPRVRLPPLPFTPGTPWPCWGNRSHPSRIPGPICASPSACPLQRPRPSPSSGAGALSPLQPHRPDSLPNPQRQPPRYAPLYPLGKGQAPGQPTLPWVAHGTARWPSSSGLAVLLSAPRGPLVLRPPRGALGRHPPGRADGDKHATVETKGRLGADTGAVQGRRGLPFREPWPWTVLTPFLGCSAEAPPLPQYMPRSSSVARHHILVALKA